MDIEQARLLVIIITAIAGLIWLTGVLFLNATIRRSQAPPDAFPEESEPAPSPPEGMIWGSTEVEGEPEPLADRAASALAQGNLFTLGPIKILEKSSHHLTFECSWPGQANRGGVRGFRRGELRFQRTRSGRTRIDWVAEVATLRWLLKVGVGVQVAGLIALVVGSWALYTYVASSPNPHIRGQTIQIVQVVHLLWPPFLFGGIYRCGRSAVRAQFDALVHNLPFITG